MEKSGSLQTAGGNINGAAAVENSMDVPQKLKVELPHDPVSPLLGIYSKELKAEVCILKFTAVLFPTS